MDLISYLLRVERCYLSKTEKNLLETMLFILVYRELCDIFKHPYEDYSKLIPFNPDQENDMFTINFIQEVIKDILSTEEYSLSGIATHTHIPEEVLSDVVTRMNTNPTFELSRRLFEFHMIVRRDLYNKVIKKILSGYLIKENTEEDK